jgi:hypothetical protein
MPVLILRLHQPQVAARQALQVRLFAVAVLVEVD